MTRLQSRRHWRSPTWSGPAAALYLLLLTVAAPAIAGAKLGDTFKQVNPAVVEIRTLRQSSLQTQAGATPVSEVGLGSGVLISSEQVLTASHVVEIADRIEVRLVDGATRKARISSSERFADVSLLTLDRPVTNVEPVRLGDSDRVEVGDQVFVVGAPYGVSHTLTVGYVSAIHRDDAASGFDLADLIQTDAAINAGNSGGPMFNERGEVIGIVSHIRSRSGGSEGLGFAIAINSARELVIDRPSFWPGFVGVLLPPELARALNVPQTSGMLVQQVADGSPAEAMGLRESDIPIDVGGKTLLIGGDIILAANGVPLVSPEAIKQIRESIRALPRGETLSIEIWREGRRRTVRFMPYVPQSSAQQVDGSIQ